jgi:hypothetical protein
MRPAVIIGGVIYRILVLEGITERGAEILRAEGWSVDMEKVFPLV